MGVHTYYSRGVSRNEEESYRLLMADIKRILESPQGEEDKIYLDYTFREDSFLLNGEGEQRSETFEWSIHNKSDYFKTNGGLYEDFAFAIMMRAVLYYPYVDFGSELGINLTYADEIYQSAFGEKFVIKCNRCGSERTAQDFNGIDGFTSMCGCTNQGGMMSFIVAGTGSRSLQSASLEDKKKAHETVTRELTRLLDKYGDELVIMTGMAEGFDKLLAIVALELNIPLYCAIPSVGYGDYYWGRKSLTGKNQIEQFNDIISRADSVVYIDQEYGITGLYRDGKHINFIRNEYMVNSAHAFLVWDPSSRGTAHCFAEILKSNKPYKILNQKEA